MPTTPREKPKPQRASVGNVVDGIVDGVVFDVCESETHRTSVKVTDHPVESGAQISDHVSVEPDALDLVARVSNHPIDLLERDNGGIDPNRAEKAYEKLLALKNARETVDAITSLRIYENMLITTLSVSRDAATGQVLALSLSLREIRTATSRSVAAPQPKIPRAQTKVTNGKKAPTPTTEPINNTFLDKAERAGLEFLGVQDPVP